MKSFKIGVLLRVLLLTAAGASGAPTANANSIQWNSINLGSGHQGGSNLAIQLNVTNNSGDTWTSAHNLVMRAPNGDAMAMTSIEGVAPGQTVDRTIYWGIPGAGGTFSFTIEALEHEEEYFSTAGNQTYTITATSEPPYAGINLTPLVFSEVDKPTISSTDVQPGWPTYRLRAKVIDGSQYGFHMAEDWNRNNYVVNRTPPSNHYGTTALYWVKYAGISGAVTDIGRERRVAITVRDTVHLAGTMGGVAAFHEVDPPQIRTGENLGADYRLFATFRSGAESWETAGEWGNNYIALKWLPPAGSYTVGLRWKRYDSARTLIETSPEKVVSAQISAGLWSGLNVLDGGIDESSWRDEETDEIHYSTSTSVHDVFLRVPGVVTTSLTSGFSGRVRDSNGNQHGDVPGVVVLPASGWYQIEVESAIGPGAFQLTGTFSTTYQEPQLTSAAQAPPGAVGAAFPGYTVTASGTGPLTFSAPPADVAGGLPPGLSLNPTTGAISGTPTLGGTYRTWISATNAGGRSGKWVTFEVASNSPMITGPAVATGSFGGGFHCQIGATNSPHSYTATGLPTGLVLDAVTGVIAGVPTEAGVFSVSLTAANASGTSVPWTLALTINRVAPSALFPGQIAENLSFFPITVEMVRGASSPSSLKLNRPVGASAHVPAPTNTGAVTFSAVLPARNNYSYPSFPPTSSFGLIRADGDLIVTGHYPGDANYLAASFSATFANRDTLPPVFPAAGPSLNQVLADAGKISLRWEPATDATAVVYDISLDNGASVHAGGIAVNAKIVEGLTPGTTYQARVRARDPGNGMTTDWSAPLAVSTLSGPPTSVAAAQRPDVNGDGLPDEIFPNGSATFSYFPLPEQPFEYTFYEWQADFIYFPGYSYSAAGPSFYHPNEPSAHHIVVPGVYVPVYSEGIVTQYFAQVTPVFQFSTSPDYTHLLAREQTRADGSKVYRPINDVSLAALLGMPGSLQEWSPGGPWLESSFDTFPTVLTRLARPPAGVQINLPGIGNVSVRAGTGGVTGTVALPGDIRITAGGGSATVTAPGTGTVTVDGNGNVSGSATLPGGYVIGAGSNGTVSISGPGGASVSTGPGGTTITIPGGTAVTVSNTGAISLAVPGGTGALIGNAVDALGKLLGLDLGTGDIRGQVLNPGSHPTQGAWQSVRDILLGNRPPGVYDVATTSDTRGRPESNVPPAPVNIVYIRLTVLPAQPVFITPAGNPVSAPVEAGSDPANIPDGANEFTFSTDVPGILTIRLKARVPGAGNATDSDKARYKFLVTSIGDSIPTWDAANPEGRPTFSGDLLEAKITFSGLPTSNAGFGAKTARLLFAGLPLVDQAFEVFYPKFMRNHPGGQPGSRNWYYYFMQTPANLTNGYPSIYNDGNRSFYNFLGDRKLYISNDAVEVGAAVWGSPVGIDAFAWVTAHEAKHHAQLPSFWAGGVYISSQDGDRPEGDFIRDSEEANYMPGRPYDPARAETYRDEIGYGGNPLAGIRDTEDINMRSQTWPYLLDRLWINGSANGHDWSNPGKNSKNIQ